MTQRDIQTLNDELALSLAEVCGLCRVRAEFVLELIDEGIVEPRGRGARGWRFDGYQVVRIQKAVRLQRDLGVNLPGIALALELLDELRRR